MQLKPLEIRSFSYYFNKGSSRSNALLWIFVTESDLRFESNLVAVKLIKCCRVRPQNHSQATSGNVNSPRQ